MQLTEGMIYLGLWFQRDKEIIMVMKDVNRQLMCQLERKLRTQHFTYERHVLRACPSDILPPARPHTPPKPTQTVLSPWNN